MKTYVNKVTGEETRYFEGQIPFRDRPYGHPLDYDYGNRHYEANAPFLKAVTFLSFERGRSAARAIYRDTHDTNDNPWTCVMFLTDLEELIHGEVNMRQFVGTMIYVKRGSNYGFKLLELS